MKLFKNIFGTKPNEISKYEPNTLAEINQSPDERNRAADQNEAEKPAAKPKEQKNITKATVEKAKSVGQKTSDTNKSGNNSKSTIKIAGSDRIVYAVKNEAKSTDLPSPTNAPAAKKVSANSASKPAPKTDNKSTDKKSATKPTADKKNTANVKPATKTDVKNTASTKTIESKAPTKKADTSQQSDVKSATKKSVSDAKTSNVKIDKATKKAHKTSEIKDATKKTETVSKSSTKSSAKATTETKPVSKPTEKKSNETAKAATKNSEPVKKSTTTPKATEKTTITANKSTVAKSTSVAPKTEKKTDTKATDKVDTKANTNSNQSNGDEITEVKATRTGKFEIKKSKDGRYVFNLYASNNVIVATSQVYSSSTSALNGIKSVVTNANAPIEDQSLKNFESVTYPKWEIYRDKGDQYRFRLCASNGSCVCHSQGYTSKTNCKKGIESIIKFAGDAEITKSYLDKKEK